MICKRIFYFLFYISFIYRSTFVLSDSTIAVPVESDSSHVNPNAASTDPATGAPLVSSVATPAVPCTDNGSFSYTFADNSASIAGSQHVTTPVSHGAQAATTVNHGAPMATPVSYDAQVASPVTLGAHVVSSPVTYPAQVATPASNATQLVAAPIAGAQVVTHVAPGTQAMATVMMPGSHVVTTPATTGTPIAGAPITQSVAAPAAHDPTAGAPLAMTPPTAGAPLAMTPPTAGAPLTMTPPTAGAPLTMTPPSAGAKVATPITPGSQAMDPNMTFVAPVTPGTQSVTYPVSHGAHVATPATPGTLSMDTSISYGQSITAPMNLAAPGSQGPQVAPPVNQTSHIVATPAMDGAPVVTINIEANLNGTNEQKQPQKIQIDIKDKVDTVSIKYRYSTDNGGTDIFYANEGYIINEIFMNGNKRWPADGDVKECKKVLYFTNPDNGRKTLRVLYADEEEAFDPDNPPAKSSDSSQGSTGIDQGGSSSPLSSERSASYTDISAGSHSLPLSSVSGSSPTDPSLDDVLSSTDPKLLSTLSQQHVYKTDPNGQVYVEFTVANGQESPVQASGSDGISAFSVEEFYAHRPGQTIDYEDSDDEFTPGEDTPVDLTTYVTRVGRRVGDLENRMDAAETTIKLLSRTLEYQHEILEFRKRFGAKTAPFGADLGRQSFFDADAFKPATSHVSKVLDATEHPSDIKLFVIDVSDASKLSELAKDKFTVNQEGDEIQYVFEPGVECKLVTFKDRTVWNHRGSEPHPTGLVFHPDDDKVVVDFEDAIVMYVKKGVLDGEDLSVGNHAKHSIVDIPLGKIESDDDAGLPKASEHENATEVDANAAPKEGDNGFVAEDVTNNASNEDPNASTSLNDDSSSALPEPVQTASVPLTTDKSPTVPHVASLTSSVTADLDHSSSVPESQPAHGTSVLTDQTMAQPVTHKSPSSANQQEVHTTHVTHVASSSAAPLSVAVPANGTTATPVSQPVTQPVTHAPVVPAGSPETTPVSHAPAVPAGSSEATPVSLSSPPSAGQPADPSGTTLSSEQDPNEGAPTV